MTEVEEGAAGAGDVAVAESSTVTALRGAFGKAILAARENRGQWRLDVDRESLVEVVTHLRDDRALKFDFLVDVTGLDHYGEEPRFRAVYVLRSMERREEIVLKVAVPEGAADGTASDGDDATWAPSVSGLFHAALGLEREAYDMFGIRFRGHPNLKRIMMPEFFQDFPLRKDFPMEGKMSDREWAQWIIERAQRLEGQGD